MLIPYVVVPPPEVRFICGHCGEQMDAVELKKREMVAHACKTCRLVVLPRRVSRPRKVEVDAPV